MTTEVETDITTTEETTVATEIMTANGDDTELC